MPISQNVYHDVLIAGGGPVGLFLACELRLTGCSVLVLEQAPDPQSPIKELPFGLRGLSASTIQSFDRRGLLDAVKAHAVDRDAPAAAHWSRQKRRPAGHFAGIQFFQDQLDASQWPYRDLGSAGGIAVDMANIEAVLTDRAIAMGVEFRHGCGVDAINATDSDVTVASGAETFRASWLVGCDGGRSAVRKAAGIAFTGTNPEFTGYSLLVKLAEPDMLAPGRHYTPTGMYTFTPPGTVAMVDFDGGAFHRSQPVTREHVEAILRKVSGVEVDVKALDLATTWTDRALQASEYRRGRVLLAGDAAHVHSPLGGQGLNLGLGDAINLGWKLAATIQGDAPFDLLDSYEKERRPVGEQVLDWSRAQVALMRPSPSSRALAAIVRDLIGTGDGATYFADRVSGLSVRYDLGGEHQLVGRSAPDFALADGTRLNEHLRNGRGLLLNFDTLTSLRIQAGQLREKIDTIRGFAKDRLGAKVVLVRPDGIVAWVAGAGKADDGLDQAASRWFG